MDNLETNTEPKRRGRPPKQVDDFELDGPAVTKVLESSERLVPMLLKHNYRPRSDHFEIVGHWTEPVKKKNAIGIVEVVKESEFVEEEQPAPQPGVGTLSPKLWAGTIVKLPRDEAMDLRRKDIASVEID